MGQQIPLKPVGTLSCSNATPVCLTDPNGLRGTWVWSCNTPQAPAPNSSDPVFNLRQQTRPPTAAELQLQNEQLRQLRLQNQQIREELNARQLQNRQQSQQVIAPIESSPSPPLPRFEPIPEPDGNAWRNFTELDKAVYLWNNPKPTGEQKRQQAALDRFYAANPLKLRILVPDAIHNLFPKATLAAH